MWSSAVCLDLVWKQLLQWNGRNVSLPSKFLECQTTNSFHLGNHRVALKAFIRKMWACGVPKKALHVTSVWEPKAGQTFWFVFKQANVNTKFNSWSFNTLIWLHSYGYTESSFFLFYKGWILLKAVIWFFFNTLKIKTVRGPMSRLSE